MHIFHSMYHAEEGWLAASNEILMMHIDYETRRSTPWRAETMQRLDALKATTFHKVLPRLGEGGPRPSPSAARHEDQEGTP